ncbi:sugar phosphate isomerase/epimerase [Candidatus Bathyarchaeota archaeon]|nr:sugar phosphate isomerase/epimerase [Candidatus Bathyarchaeota archaeon]
MSWNISMCWLYAITKYRYIPSLGEVLSAIDDAKRLGFQYMELEGIGSQLYMIVENKEIIKKKLSDNGIKLVDFVPVLPDMMSVDPQKRSKALKDFKVGCEVASYLEADIVQADSFYLPIHVERPYDVSKEFRYTYKPPLMKIDPNFNFWRFFEDVAVSSISECNDIAKDHGLKLCIEPRTWETISNAWALELLLREVKSENLGAVLDVAHLAAQKMHPVQCVEMLGKRIFYVHASDSDFMMEDHLEIGTGMVDWKSFLEALKKHGFKGCIGIDVGGKEEMKQKLDSMYINSRKYLENLMKEIM